MSDPFLHFCDINLMRKVWVVVARIAQTIHFYAQAGFRTVFSDDLPADRIRIESFARVLYSARGRMRETRQVIFVKICCRNYEEDSSHQTVV
jgi:hypothetical protein